MYILSQGKAARTLVYCDDFATSGPREQYAWMKQQLDKRFEIKAKVIGVGTEYVREEISIHRVIRVTNEGQEMDAAQGHDNIIIESVNLKDAKGITRHAKKKEDGKMKILRLFWKQREAGNAVTGSRRQLLGPGEMR